MSSNTFNGWTNYATWRVNLEMFDGEAFDPTDIWPERPEVAEVADSLKAMAEDAVAAEAKGFALDYALAFLSDANWREIASWMIDAYYEEEA